MVIEETDQAAGFSKSLPSFAFGDVDGQRYDDVEYLPEDFRFEAQDGYVSNPDNSDAQALTDRLIPILRNKSLYIKTAIKTKELRDPRLRDMAVKGFSRELRNKIDTYCYNKAITQADTSAAEMIKAQADVMDKQVDTYNAETDRVKVMVDAKRYDADIDIKQAKLQVDMIGKM